MKKHDEGYALVLVLVVMVVLCLVALSMMSVSLHNMENQRASIQRMQDQYAAEGAIEAVLAEFGKTTVVTIEEGTYENAFIDRLQSHCDSVCQQYGYAVVKIVEGTPEIKTGNQHEDITFSFTLMATSGNEQVTCDMELTATMRKQHSEYFLSHSKLTYKSYTISTMTEGGEAA